MLDLRIALIPAMVFIASFMFLLYIEKVREGRTYDKALENCTYDIDLARYQYIKDMSTAFRTGCDIGTEYPEKYKIPTTEFNQNSTPIWCGRELKKFDLFIEGSVSKLGKRKIK